MLHQYAYTVAVLVTLGLLVWRGGRDEWVGFGILILGSLLTPIVEVRSRWTTTEVATLIVDLLVALALVRLAMRSDRFWPLWASAFQIATVLAHGFHAVQSKIAPQIYYFAESLWAYPVLIAIAIGAAARPRRRAASSI